MAIVENEGWEDNKVQELGINFDNEDVCEWRCPASYAGLPINTEELEDAAKAFGAAVFMMIVLPIIIGVCICACLIYCLCCKKKQPQVNSPDLILKANSTFRPLSSSKQLSKKTDYEFRTTKTIHFSLK